jgi:sulfate transport system ATP-binding protein
MSVIVDRLTKRYTASGAPAVDNVSLVAETGRVLALVGPSGSGKSTVLRAIAGLEFVDAGTISIGGRACEHVAIRDREVGFVFQNYALFSHMSVADNIGFALKIRRRPRAEIAARVRELLDLIRLPDIGRRLPSQLSGGQRQRVAFARAIANQPKVLLLDEPFGALDANVRLELRDWLRTFHAQTKMTTIIVTHDQEEAFEIADQIVVLMNGKVCQAATPSEVYDHPASPEVASFLGGANLFAVATRGQTVGLGAYSTAVPTSSQEGDAMSLMVRPHDFVILKTPTDGNGHIQAKVQSIRRVGPHAKVLVALATGESVLVHTTIHEIASLDLTESDEVWVQVRRASVFPPDYTI